MLYTKNDALRSIFEHPIWCTDFSDHTKKALIDYGIERLEGLVLMSEESVASIPGIDDASMKEIRGLFEAKKLVFSSTSGSYAHW